MQNEYDYSQIENYQTLRKLQMVQLEILKYIDSFCRENNIRYSLSGGTLLGAVRHGGFIPWDDDLDICMLRSEYNRFVQLWNSCQHDKYLLQSKDNTPAFTQSFVKIRKDHTTFYQEGELPGIYHMGIFVDIFPIDRIPNGKLKEYLFYWRVIRYQIFVREFIPPDASIISKLLLRIIFSLNSTETRKKKRDKLLKKITQYNDDTRFRLVGIDTINAMRKSFSSNLWDELTTIEFEKSFFPCYANWKEYLTNFYGDYLKLPPKEEQTWYHHPVILDFEHNYEELKNGKEPE